MAVITFDKDYVSPGSVDHFNQNLRAEVVFEKSYPGSGKDVQEKIKTRTNELGLGILLSYNVREIGTSHNIPLILLKNLSKNVAILASNISSPLFKYSKKCFIASLNFLEVLFIYYHVIAYSMYEQSKQAILDEFLNNSKSKLQESVQLVETAIDVLKLGKKESKQVLKPYVAKITSLANEIFTDLPAIEQIGLAKGLNQAINNINKYVK